jgi:uncharacterized membrane protein (DUF485 family)
VRDDGPQATRRLEPVPMPFTTSAGPDYLTIRNSPEFGKLRRDIRRLQLGCALTLLLPVGALTYVAAYRSGWLSTQVAATHSLSLIVPAVLLAGLGPGTIAFYLWRYRNRIEPQIKEIRRRAGVSGT